MSATVNDPGELAEWIAGHPQRHQKAGPRLCSCGWDGSVFGPDARDVMWENHESVTLISGLGDVLPSDTSMLGAGSPLSWREEVDHLRGVLEKYHDNCTCDAMGVLP